MKNINKKGQGHIEMMLSFVLFLAAVLFIFFYIKPFDNTTGHSDELNSVQNIIINYITSNVGRLSIVSSSPSGCYDFNPLNYTDSSGKYVEVVENSPSTKKLYTIYFGDPSIFPNIITPHKSACSVSDYTLGVFSNQTIISYRKIQQFVQDLNDPMKQVKKDLGINADFSINTTDFNRNPIPALSFSKNIPGTVEVESKEFPIVAINDSGQSNELILNIKVW